MFYLQFINKVDIKVLIGSTDLTSNGTPGVNNNLLGLGCGTVPAGPLSVLGTVFPPS